MENILEGEMIPVAMLILLVLLFSNMAVALVLIREEKRDKLVYAQEILERVEEEFKRGIPDGEWSHDYKGGYIDGLIYGRSLVIHAMKECVDGENES